MIIFLTTFCSIYIVDAFFLIFLNYAFIRLINNSNILGKIDRKKLLAANLLATNCILLRRQRRRRLYHVHPINLKRPELSEFRLFDELLVYPPRFKSYLRMGPDDFLLVGSSERWVYDFAYLNFKNRRLSKNKQASHRVPPSPPIFL